MHRLDYGSHLSQLWPSPLWSDKCHLWGGTVIPLSCSLLGDCREIQGEDLCKFAKLNPLFMGADAYPCAVTWIVRHFFSVVLKQCKSLCDIQVECPASVSFTIALLTIIPLNQTPPLLYHYLSPETHPRPQLWLISREMILRENLCLLDYPVLHGSHADKGAHRCWGRACDQEWQVFTEDPGQRWRAHQPSSMALVSWGQLLFWPWITNFVSDQLVLSVAISYR